MISTINEEPPPYESVLRRDRVSPAEEPRYLSLLQEEVTRESSGYYVLPDSVRPGSDVYASVKDVDVYTVSKYSKGPTERSYLEYPPLPPPRKSKTATMKILLAFVVAFVLGVSVTAAGVLVATREDGNSSAENRNDAPGLLSTTMTTTTNSPDVDAVMCESETCSVSSIGTEGLAVPAYDSYGGYQTYGCQTCRQKNCLSEVHMLSMYEPEGSYRGFQQEPENVLEVPVSVISSTQHLPLTFVLSTYEAANRVINVPDGVTVVHVFLMSYYLSYSSVKVVDANGAEMTGYTLHSPSYKYTRLDYEGTGGSSSNSKSVDYIVEEMTSQYGYLASFTGRYEAKSWTLNLDSLNDCDDSLIDSQDEDPVIPPPPATSPPSATETEHTDCSTNPCENGANCIDWAGARPYHCFCSYPYYGERCEYEEEAETCDITWQTVGMATPFIQSNGGYNTYNCDLCPAASCSSEVHIIAMYEPEGSVRGFQQDPVNVVDVPVTVRGSSDHLPLTIMLATYEAANWVITVPDGVTVANVLLTSYYLSFSSVRVQNEEGATLSNYRLHQSREYVEHKGTCETVNWGFGFDRSCFGVDKVVEEMTSQYGCFTSFSGRYEATSWTLDLDDNDC